MPDLDKTSLRYELRARYNMPTDIDLYRLLSGKHDELKRLIRRVFLEEDAGVCTLIEKESSKECRARVTRFIEMWGKHTYTVWLDSSPAPKVLGTMKINFYWKRADGELWAPSLGTNQGVCPGSYIDDYGKNSNGLVFVDDLSGDGAVEGGTGFRGAGSSLMMIASRVSWERNYSGFVMLYSGLQSQGFYRKLGFTRGSKKIDSKIDAEVALAKRERRAPDTGKFCGHMHLDKAARLLHHTLLFKKEESKTS
ncbi:MAG: hypothetical protein HYX48_00860 [Chlamydiales bacterium]|nr:hypothetical protein [Chlamydiales bacterium]